jgi:hypothetical protein
MLEKEGIAVDATSRQRLEVWKAVEQATEQQYKRSQGDSSPDPAADRFPEDPADTAPVVSTSDVTLSVIFERCAKDHLANEKSPNTVIDFGRKIDALKAYLGHEDVGRITPMEISQWCYSADVMKKS